MSTVMNEGVKMHCKSVMTNVFTLVCIILELIKAIEKPKCSLQ